MGSHNQAHGEAGRDEPDDDVTLEGEILLPPEDRPERIARVVTRVEDVSLADAPAVTVADQVQEGVSLPAGEHGLRYKIRVPARLLDPAHRYGVRVHLDVAGTGDVTPGDYVSTTSTPVSPRTPKARVAVRRVN